MALSAPIALSFTGENGQYWSFSPANDRGGGQATAFSLTTSRSATAVLLRPSAIQLSTSLIGCRREALPNSERIDLTGDLRANGNDEIKVFFDTTWCIGGSMTVSFLVNGQTHQNTEWRLNGTAGEWVCDETVTWTVNKGDGTARQIDGPPAVTVIR